jgi:hypothetical protein
MQYKARMPAHVIIWDLETMPDLHGFWLNSTAGTLASGTVAILVWIRQTSAG